MIDVSVLNNSAILSAMSMMMMNLASRHIHMDLGFEVNDMLQSPIARRLVVFCIIYVATRRFLYALVGTFVFYIVFRILLNTNSKGCLLKKKEGYPAQRSNSLTRDEAKLLEDIIQNSNLDSDVYGKIYQDRVDSLVLKLRSIHG